MILYLETENMKAEFSIFQMATYFKICTYSRFRLIQKLILFNIVIYFQAQFNLYKLNDCNAAF